MFSCMINFHLMSVGGNGCYKVASPEFLLLQNKKIIGFLSKFVWNPTKATPHAAPTVEYDQTIKKNNFKTFSVILRRAESSFSDCLVV